VRYLSHALSPFNEGEDFEETLREWALHLKNKTGITIHLVSSTSIKKINGDNSIHVFRIIQEATANSIKHGNAKNVFIQFLELNNTVSISIEDDGCGFNTSALPSGLGLKHMKTRAQHLNAEFTIQSDSNTGTFIQLVLPFNA